LIRPPCWPKGIQCPNPCAEAYYEHVINNHVSLCGPWAGWRLAGRDLVSPNKERISVERMRGLLWDALRRGNNARKARQQASVKVIVVDLADWRERHFGRAG
jgi:hypothetical protein